MAITVKNVKIHDELSEETLCFSASVYFNGKRVGVATNRGNGGCNDYDWLEKETGREIHEWANAQKLTYTNWEGEEEEVTFEKLDHIVTNLVEEFEDKQWFKKKCKTSILFVREGDAEGSYGVLPHKGRLEAHLNYIKGEAEKEKMKQIIYLRDSEVVFEDL